jgi:hypothetical protein
LSKRTSLDDQTALDELAELLGDLPLALEEAAAYLEETQVSMDEYLALVRGRARRCSAWISCPTMSRVTRGGWRRSGRCRWNGSTSRHRPPRRCEPVRVPGPWGAETRL